MWPQFEEPRCESYHHVKSLDRQILASRIMDVAPALKQLSLVILPALCSGDKRYHLFIEGEGMNRKVVRVASERIREFQRQAGMHSHDY